MPYFLMAASKRLIRLGVFGAAAYRRTEALQRKEC